MGSEERCDLDVRASQVGRGCGRRAPGRGGAGRGPGRAATPTERVKMALAVGMRVLSRSLLRPWVRGPGAAPGRTGPAAGGGDGVRCFGSPRVLVEPDPAAGFAVMKMRNPPVNTLSLEFLTELLISLEKLENDKAFHAVIITSDCPGIFSAGLDLTEMCGRDPTHYAEYWKAVQELWLRFYLSHLVVISAINGVSPAGGCLLALSSDYRVLADNPKYAIGLNETLLGIIAPFWFKDTLVNTVGHRTAERALQLGLLFPPAEALQVGMVDQVVPEDQLQSAARSVLAQWLAVPGRARQLTKSLVRKATADRLLRERDADIQNFVRFISGDAVQKNLRAYLEKLKQKKS